MHFNNKYPPKIFKNFGRHNGTLIFVLTKPWYRRWWVSMAPRLGPSWLRWTRRRATGLASPRPKPSRSTQTCSASWSAPSISSTGSDPGRRRNMRLGPRGNLRPSAVSSEWSSSILALCVQEVSTGLYSDHTKKNWTRLCKKKCKMFAN